MTYRKSIRFVDDLFLSFAIFILIFVWCRYFLHSMIGSLVLSVILTILLSVSIVALKQRKQTTKQDAELNYKNIDDAMTYLLLSSNNEIVTMLNSKIQGKICGKIIIKDNDIYYPYFEDKVFTANTLYKILKTFPPEYNLILMAINFDLDTVRLASQIKSITITLISKTKLMEYIPKVIDISTKIAPKKKNSLKDYLMLFIRPENEKGYLFSALYILLACLIMPHTLYYIIFITFLLSLAIVCHIRKKSLQ